MQVLVMTKPFGAVEPQRLAEIIAGLPVDGVELVVRAGQTVTPAEPDGIGVVAKELERVGARIGIVTTDLLAGGETADRVLGACAEAGATLIRIGHFGYDPGIGYPRGLGQARQGLGELTELAGRHGVRLALQVHQGSIHPSAALALRLAEGFDDLLFYADPGNQAKEGSEDWRLHLDQLGDRIACVGVKNAIWTDDAGNWRCEWQPFADGGVVRWPDTIAELRARGYTGPLSMHAHYPMADPVASVGGDLRHLGDLLR